MQRAQANLLGFGVELRLPTQSVSSLAAFAGKDVAGCARTCHTMEGAFLDDAHFSFAGPAKTLLLQAPFVAAAIYRGSQHARTQS
eukprot:3115342-Pyramimonas_sp.AAC.1